MQPNVNHRSKAAWLSIMLFVVLAAVYQPSSAQDEDETQAPQDTTGIVVQMDAPDSTVAQKDTIEFAEAHPQDSPEERGFLIITSDGRARLRIRGSVRINGAYDFNGLQSEDLFATFEIPVGEANKTEPRFFMSANQTRLGIEASRETSIGDVYMRIEGDFLGQGDPFRLRHAYGSLRNGLAGQTWSTFGDPTSIPQTVDLDGPNSSVTQRTVQFRYTRDISDNFRWALGLESPRPDISQPDTLEPAFQSFPDIALRLRTFGPASHVQLAGVFRSITVRRQTGDLDYLAGYGGLLSGKIKLARLDHFYFQLVAGEGVSRFITALTDRGMDLTFNPNTGELETVPVWGGFVSVGHTWKSNLSSYMTAGLTDVLNKDFEPDDAFNTSYYFSVNTFWVVTEGARTGIEYSFGRRKNKDGQDGTANRISFIVYYDF